MIIKPSELNIEDYHASDCITSTKLRQFLTSPETYKDRLNGTHPDCNKKSDGRHFFVGNLFEDMITLSTEELQGIYFFCKGGEPEKPSQRILDAKKPSKESIIKMRDYSLFLGRVGNKKIVTEKECKTLDKMMQNYFKNSKATQLWNNSEYQLTIREEFKGHTLQCRFDGVNTQTDIAVDLKTTGKPLEEFAKSVFEYRYDLQLGYYSELYYMHFGRELKEFKFIVCESVYPYRCQVLTLPRVVLEMASATVVAGIKDMVDCINSNEFPETDETGVLNFNHYQLEQMGIE